ncbi:MAG: DUF4421 domain-containing protein [Bacteroidota bacterium]|nr:DUF4421 domain-containing protein [Bacteroidota bacterium]
MNVSSIYYFLILFHLSFFAYSQDINIQDTVQNEYVKSYSEFMNVRSITSFRNLSINVSERGQSPIADYSPNNRGFIGFGAFIFDLGIEVAFKYPKAFEKDKEVYGSTDFIDIQSHIYGKTVNFDLTYQKYEGFYLSNVNDFEHFASDEIKVPVRGDLKATNAIINILYLFNSDKFSFRSAYNQTEKQLKNAGSFLVINSFNYFRLQGDSVILYSQTIDPFSNGTSLLDGKFYTFSILPGYAYNLPWKNFLLNFTLSAGAGIQHQVYVLEDREDNSWQIEPKINFRSALTYDNNKFFGGINYFIHNSYSSVNDMRIHSEVSNFRIFAGYRFKKFGIFKRYSINQVLNPIKHKLFGDEN